MKRPCLQQLAHLSSLKELRIREQRYRPSRNITLGRLPITLTHLYLRIGFDLANDNIRELQRLRALKVLHIPESHSVTGEHFAGLTKSLASLNCKGCPVTQGNIDSLIDFEQLEEVSLSFTQETSPFRVTETVRNLPENVRKLSLHWENSVLGILWQDYRVQLQTIGLEALLQLTDLKLDIDQHFLELMGSRENIRFFETLQRLSRLKTLCFTCLPHMIRLHLLEKLPPSLRSLHLIMHLYDDTQIPASITNAVARFQSNHSDCTVTYSTIVHWSPSSID